MREMLVPLTLYDGVQRESRTRDNIRSLSRAIQNILTQCVERRVLFDALHFRQNFCAENTRVSIKVGND